MEHVSWLTQLVNHYLGAAALALLAALHITPSKPEAPIPEHVVMSLMVLVVGTVLALLLRSRLSVERPGVSQQVAELLLTNSMGFGINDVLEENAGHHWQRYVPMVGSVALFVLLANLFGAFPLFTSPTAVYTVPLSCAIFAFVYFNWQGLRHHGALGYVKTFTGGVHWSLWPLIFPVEILSTCARLLSLSVRLWANIFASDLIYGLFLG
ncbi:MAG TPA: F0F1 ATP synthase subunit A, partial [Candidatus Acidoferrum sp.]|nr:F0F1 ATP synthase subunit A [Candidatus Acidoferrum sp.]